jgi:hypothetical protein
MNKGTKRHDWMGFVVHFVCGGVLGALLGFRLWITTDWISSTPAVRGAILMGGSALLFGLAAGIRQQTGGTLFEDGDDWVDIRWSKAKFCLAAALIFLIVVCVLDLFD